MRVTGFAMAFALLSFSSIGPLSAQAVQYSPEDVPSLVMQTTAATQTGDVCHRPLLLGLPNCDNPHRNMHVNGGSRPRSSGDPCDNCRVRH